MKDQGLTVLLVDLWEKPARVAKTVAERGYAMRVVIDPDGTVSKRPHRRGGAASCASVWPPPPAPSTRPPGPRRSEPMDTARGRGETPAARGENSRVRRFSRASHPALTSAR